MRLHGRTFQSTLPHGERRRDLSVFSPLDECFNPRSRAGSDGHNDPDDHVNIAVSIHAPARGATCNMRVGPPGCRRFQSTLPHGERLQVQTTSLAKGEGFNPRSRTGSDRWPKSPSDLVIECFNPRSRAGSDVASSQTSLAKANGFNPRSRTGSDCELEADAGDDEVFQSTLPHGERRRSLAARRTRYRFQSTLPHGERRGVRSGRRRSNEVFQSTLPHGERRRSLGCAANAIPVSIHAPARGATSMPASTAAIASRFNPRSRTGSDMDHRELCGAAYGFQSTLPHGERPGRRFTWI